MLLSNPTILSYSPNLSDVRVLSVFFYCLGCNHRFIYLMANENEAQECGYVMLIARFFFLLYYFFMMNRKRCRNLLIDYVYVCNCSID